MAISKKSYLILARETTPGTAVLTGNKLFSVPSKSMIKAVKKREYPQEERGDRNAQYTAIDTTREADIDIKGNWYNDVDGLLLYAYFGADAVSQPNASSVPSAYLHTFTFADIPPSLTVHKSFDAKAYYSAYAVLEKLTLKFTAQGKLFERDATLKGLWPTLNASPPTPAFSTVNPMAGFAPIITLGGSTTTDIDEFQIEMSQKCTLWYPCNGVPDFSAVYFGERSMKIDFSARFDNDTVYQRYKQGQNDSFSFSIAGDLIGGTLYQQLTMTFPTVGYDSMEHDLGKDNVMIKAKGTILPTNGSLTSLCTVQNTIASY